jgi:hypothetical protein
MNLSLILITMRVRLKDRECYTHVGSGAMHQRATGQRIQEHGKEDGKADFKDQGVNRN